MAITVNVTGITGGGGNHQPPQQPPSQPTPPPSQYGGQQPPSPPSSANTGYQNTSRTMNSRGSYDAYERPDFQQYAYNQAGTTNTPLPTSDTMVQDIRREMTTRGIVLVPGTNNFSTMMNTLKQQQRSNVMGQIESDYQSRLTSIDLNKDAYINEITSRLEDSRSKELAGVTSKQGRDRINKTYDELLESEYKKADRLFAGQYSDAAVERGQRISDVEQRLTEAIQRLTEEMSQGNANSYLGQLRDKYKEAVWRRDNAETEEGVREASREAAKIQERIQRAMNGGISPTAMKYMSAAGTAITVLGNAALQSTMLSDQQTWGLGLEQASSVLSGNAFQAIRQRNAYENQQTTIWSSAGGAAAGAISGALIGSLVPGLGTLIGGIIGGLLGGLGGNAVAYGLNRERLREDKRVQAADLWRQEEQRMLAYNDLVMLTRGSNNDIGGVRNWYIAQSSDAARSKLQVEGRENTLSINARAFTPGATDLDKANGVRGYLTAYDLGYTAPEFAQKAAQRIKQRGFVNDDSIQNALYADALERVFSMNAGSLGALSAYDRFGNNANQDFSNLAKTLANLGTTGMSEGGWARSDEFAGYMTQLQSAQRGTFLTVDNARAGRQIATGQAVFGDKFGNEAMQGIQQINNQVQNPGQGFIRTLLYDVIQELYPYTRGDLRKIKMAQFDPTKQNEIQTALAKRVAAIYGSPDTTTGFLAFQEIYGINNPNVLNPLAKQMLSGGLEARGLDRASQAELVQPMNSAGYTPEITKNLNIAADNVMSELLGYQESMVQISNRLLEILRDDTNQTLREAVAALKK